MRLSIATSVAAALLGLLLLSLSATAETVHFRTATTPPTPLQQRLARERGQAVLEQPSEEIAGELYRPPGNGPFPAVVLLHGCAGRPSRKAEDVSVARFVALGYVLLIVDSFGPRNVKERCTEFGPGPPVDRVMDAYGGLLYLAGSPFIDPDRIAVVGYSQGGMVALSAAALGGIDTLFDRHFRTAIAYYPPCGSLTGSVSIPTLVLIGELDDWTPAQDCRDMMARRTGEGAPLRLVVYSGAYHGFNGTTLRDKPRTFFGHHIEYNEAADQAAWKETVRALRQAFER
ncbi:MAG: dienelactone hydrolase family protein [Reyranellales bacterium]